MSKKAIPQIFHFNPIFDIINLVKVLILTGIFPPDIGGPATQLDYLIRDLIKRDFEISVLTFGDAARRSDLPREIGSPAYPVKKISKKIPQPWRNFFYIFSALKMSGKFDVIYGWDLYTAGFSGFLIKKIFPRKKFIVRFAGDSAWEKYVNKFSIFPPKADPPSADNFSAQGGPASGGQFSNHEFDDIEKFQGKKYGLRIEFRKLIRKKIMTSADKVVAVSFFLAGLAEKIGVKKEKIKVIYNSVDFLFEGREEPPDKDYCRNKLGFKGVNLVSASRLVPWKGHRALIEIMPELIKNYGDIHLWIVGEGPEREALKFSISPASTSRGEAGSFQLSNNVFLTGKLPHQKLFEYLKCADIFVLNTGYEGLSHTILEAMHSGIPVVTTNVCSNPEIIQNKKSGFLVEYNNREELKKAISELIDRPEIGQSFANEAKKNLEKFKWENLIRGTIAVLSDEKPFI